MWLQWVSSTDPILDKTVRLDIYPPPSRGENVLYHLFKSSRATSKMYFYRKNGVWTYFNLWKHHNMVPFLLSDQHLTSPSESEEQNLSHLLICNILGELSTWLAHTCAENQTRPTSSSTAFQYNLGIFPLTFTLPWFFSARNGLPSFSFLSAHVSSICCEGWRRISPPSWRWPSELLLTPHWLHSRFLQEGTVTTRSGVVAPHGSVGDGRTFPIHLEAGHLSPEARLRGSHHSFTCENMSLNLDCPQGKCHWSLREGTSYRGTQTMAGPWGKQCITQESLFRKPDFQMEGISVPRGC